MELKALVLTGYGINCEKESQYAIEKSGGNADIVHLNNLLNKPDVLHEYNMLMVPGGFSFGDDIGSGKVFANKMKFELMEPIRRFINDGKLVLGICNGFQVLVKMGLLPETDFNQTVSLVGNDSGHFEDRWVILRVNKLSPCIFTKGIDFMLLPIRHGEGKFVAPRSVLDGLKQKNQIVLQYVGEDMKLGGYPWNPNGSMEGIAGICDPTGRVYGMMPHPEAFNIPENCPYWVRGSVKEAMGLKIFKNAVDYAERNL